MSANSFIARRSNSSFGSISASGTRGDHRIDRPRNHVLSEHDRDPARVRKQLALVAQKTSAFGEQRQPSLQRLRGSHVPAVTPERLVALVGVVVQDEQVAHLLEILLHPAVVFVAKNRRLRSVGKQRDEAADALPDEVQRRRFQRLEKTRRETDGDAVLLPEFLAMAGREADEPRRYPCIWPSRPSISMDVASSSLMNSLQKMCPLPVRRCVGIFHCQPADFAVDRV